MHTLVDTNMGGRGSLLRVNAASFTDIILDDVEAERIVHDRIIEMKESSTHADGWPHVLNSDD